jgi:hypothetical protein
MTNRPDEIVLGDDTVDIEQVLTEVLTPMFQSLSKELKTYVKTEIEQTYKAQQPVADEDDSEDSSDVSPEVKALQRKLQAMEQKALEQEQREKANKLNSTLSDIVQGYKSDAPKLASLALKEHLGELVEASDGSYLTKDGRSIQDAAKEFFQTPDGMRLLPSDMRQGSGLPQGKPPRSQGSGDVSTDDAILRTFGASL